MIKLIVWCEKAMGTSSVSSDGWCSFGESTDEDEESKGPTIEQILQTVTRTVHTMLQKNATNENMYRAYLENTKESGGVYRTDLVKHWKDIHTESRRLEQSLSQESIVNGARFTGINFYMLHDVKNHMKRMKEAELLYGAFKQMQEMRKIMDGVERVKKQDLMEQVSNQMEDMREIMQGVERVKKQELMEVVSDQMEEMKEVMNGAYFESPGQTTG